MNTFQKFVKRLSLLALTILAAYFLLMEIIPVNWKVASSMLLYFYIVSITANYFLLQKSDIKGGATVRSILGATALKMLIYLAGMIVFCFACKAHLEWTIFMFLFLYVVFTVFEKIYLYRFFLNKLK